MNIFIGDEIVVMIIISISTVSKIIGVVFVMIGLVFFIEKKNPALMARNRT